MAISTVNELLTSTRKIILQVGVTQTSTYTLQAAIDYYLAQVNSLQSENPDVEVVAKMLDRRTTEVAIAEGAGRGNVYDIYSDAYVAKYSLGSSFSLAIDKVGIDGIGDKVNASIQAKIDDGSIGTGGSDIVTEFSGTTLDIFGTFKLENADLTYNGMTGHHSINNTFGGLIPSISGVTYYSAADNDGSNSIYIIYDTNVNDYNSVTMHFNDTLLATITTSELGVYGFMIPNTVTGTGTLAIKNNDVVLHSEEVTITDGQIPFSGTKTTPVKTYVDNVGATIPTDADINNLIELAIQSKIDRGLLAEAEVSIVGVNINGLLFSFYTKGKYAPTGFTDGSLYDLGSSDEDTPVVVVEYAQTGLGWNAYRFSFAEYTESTQPYNAGTYLIIPINPSTDFSNPVSLTISNTFGDFLSDGASITIDLVNKSISIPAAVAIISSFDVVDPSDETITGTVSYSINEIKASLEYINLSLSLNSDVPHSFDSIEYEVDGNGISTTKFYQNGPASYGVEIPTNPSDNSTVTVRLMHTGVTVYSFKVNKVNGITELNSI